MVRGGRAPDLDLAVNAKYFCHFRLERGVALLYVIATPRLREGRLLCGLISCAARILHTVPWASFARLGWPACGPWSRACAANGRVPPHLRHISRLTRAPD